MRVHHKGKQRELPKGWIWTTVKDIFEVIGGGTPSTTVSEYWNGEIPWITSADIHGLKEILPRKKITKKAIEASSTNLVPENSIIVVTRVSLGKVALAGFPLCFSQDSQGLIGNPEIVLSEYALYYLSDAVQEFKHTGRGTTISGVTKKQLKDLAFVLPPLNEQQRIVEKIEEFFSQLDFGITELKRVQANLARYKASVLKAACEGRLVPTEAELAKAEGRNYESGEELLQRILAERKKKWEDEHRAKGNDPTEMQYQEPKPPDTKDLHELPEGWVWATVNQLVYVATGATPLRSNSIYWEKGSVPWVTSGSLNNLYIDEADEYITELALQDTNTKLFPEGTLLVAMYGEGRTRGKVSELRIEASTNQACAALLFTEESYGCKPYLKIFFQKNYEDIRRLSSGGVQPNLNLTIIRQTQIPFPPLAEQMRIVNEVERKLSVIQEMETIVTANLKRAKRMRQAILKRAFEGNLVPQDPGDEPAPTLPRRIKSNRHDGKQLEMFSE